MPEHPTDTIDPNDPPTDTYDPTTAPAPPTPDAAPSSRDPVTTMAPAGLTEVHPVVPIDPAVVHA